MLGRNLAISVFLLACRALIVLVKVYLRRVIDGPQFDFVKVMGCFMANLVRALLHAGETKRLCVW